MATKTQSPVFPLPEELEDHFSDYGFDPQIHYFQFLEEARKHKPEATANLQSNLQNLPIDPPKTTTHKAKKIKKQRWWKNALLFFNLKRAHRQEQLGGRGRSEKEVRKPKAASMSGPIYIVESRSGSTTPYRNTSRRPYSGPLAGTLSPAAEWGQIDYLPYVSLKEHNDMELEQRVSTSAMPIYLVT